MRTQSRFAILLTALVLLTGPVPGAGWPGGQIAGPAIAYADDDDGGDDGDDGGGGVGRGWGGSDRSGGSPGGGTNLFRELRKKFQRSEPRRPAARRAAVPTPLRADRQIIATGLTAEQIGQLTSEGFTILDTDPLAFAGGDVIKLDAPASLAIEAALARVRSVAPDAPADFNHFFRPGEADVACEGRHCVAPSMVGWPAQGIGGCAATRGITIGLIDTSINAEHAVFGNGQVEAIRLSDDELPQSGLQHGTAVAALLIGSAETATPGLLPTAKLIAVDAFHQGARKDDRAEAYDLVRALDLLAERKAQVVNMSLSGPANTLVEAMASRLAGEDIVLVAAAGNGGPRAAPAYPAAYANVIAVTAVDRAKRAYRRAGQGEHIDLAAPGVDVWTAASIKGARPKTGTSFAAPFVTAAAALLASSGEELTAAEIEARLARTAEDLGAPGKDPVFGWGLLNAREVCK